MLERTARCLKKSAQRHGEREFTPSCNLFNRALNNSTGVAGDSALLSPTCDFDSTNSTFGVQARGLFDELR